MNIKTPEQIAQEVADQEEGRFTDFRSARLDAACAAIEIDRAQRAPATSASDRYEKAREVIAWLDDIDSSGLGLSGAEDAARAALRALIEAPDICENPEVIAGRIADSVVVRTIPAAVMRTVAHGYAERAALAGFHAGMQAALESWEPENAPGMVDTRATYTIASLDGTDDAADWLTAGHVLTAQEAEWLCALEVVR